ncbi:hypothetical protein [Thermoanaerobacter sp. RKWS2]|uniref:hypothetical protein n=1 Tax=Thermoanaerobacter sp. RKWS2 TaxID=2983842 RepID=UPI00224B3F3B|nr:hypothetical protein [Thermoanaerobacter sp. RKWS2]UZQ81824.1 hypothetical protein OEI98_001563 [Thermoanaerobacter sp. RKWS2]
MLLLVLIALAAASILFSIVLTLSLHIGKLSGSSRAALQARYAAYTGIERTKYFLAVDPNWLNGKVAEGPVDESSKVQKVTIERTDRETIVITSTGECSGVRKTIRAKIQIGLVPLVSAYGSGIKQLKPLSLEFSGSSLIKSDVLVNGTLYIWGSSVVGLPGENRIVYVNGDVYTLKNGAVNGSIYAVGWADPKAATGQVISNWVPAVQFPSVQEINTLINYARESSQALEKATGRQHYFPGNKIFTEAELKNAEGVYFVEGDAYIQGGATSANAAVAASGSIYINSSFTAENMTLIAGSSISLKNSTSVSVALAVGSNVGWESTGGGKAVLTLKYGALAAGTINGGSVRGNVVLEQNNAVNFYVLSAPIHTTRIISYSELK